MAYDLDRILPAIAGASDFEDRLSASAALQHMLNVEIDPATADWEALTAKVLPSLVTGLGDPYKGVQVHCANCLEFLAHRSPTVIPRLRTVMAESDAWRAWGAALVAARMGTWYPELGPALTGAMGAKDRDVRWAAANLLVTLGRSAAEAVAATGTAVRAEHAITRKMAAYALGAMGAYSDVTGTLVTLLRDDDRDVRRATILAFAKLPDVGPEARLAIAALRQDPDEFVRRTAAAVAAKLGA